MARSSDTGLRRRAVAAVGAALLLAMAGAAPAAALVLAPHHAVYALTLDGSRPTGQIEEMNGLIDYEIRGDACAGYTTVTRQTSESRGGERKVLRQSVTSKAWEDGAGEAYRFLSTTDDGDGPQEVEARATRDRPDELSLTLKGEILMPTQHIAHVLKAASAGTQVLAAKVYDGASDPAKVYETLAVIGRPCSGGDRLVAEAQRALAGHVAYPVAVSYFEPGALDEAPAYVMSFSLYDNGVVGDLKIDYGQFALVGRMTAFETLPGSADCAK